MDTKRIEKPVKSFLRALPKQYKIDRLIIFGSSTEKTHKYRDIDILLVSPQFQDEDEEKRLDMLYRASRFIEPEIHPWGVTPDELKSAESTTLLGYIRDSGIDLLL